MSRTHVFRCRVVVEKSAVGRLISVCQQEVGGVVAARAAFELDKKPIACKIYMKDDLIHLTVFFLSTKSRTTKGINRMQLYFNLRQCRCTSPIQGGRCGLTPTARVYSEGKLCARFLTVGSKSIAVQPKMELISQQGKCRPLLDTWTIASDRQGILHADDPGWGERNGVQPEWCRILDPGTTGGTRTLRSLGRRT